MMKQKNNVLTWAQSYIEAGLSAIPCKADKKPLCSWKKYQSQKPTADEWDTWSNAPAVALVGGAVSGNLLILDFDQQGKAVQEWSENIPQELFKRLPIEMSPSGGFHVFFRCKNPVIGNEKLAKDENGVLIETRGEGGYCLCYPSQGYRMFQGDLCSIPTLSQADVDILIDTAKQLDKTPVPKTENRVRNTAPTVGLPDEDAEKRAVACIAEKRAVAYIAKMPEAIQGQNGSADAMRVANKLYEFKLDRASAKRIFIEHYNPRCVPMWSEKEIDHKLDSAYEKPIREFGEKLHQQNDKYHIRHAVNELKEKCWLGDSEPATVESSIEPFEDFPTDALPVVMQNMIRTIAKAQSLPEAFIAYPALAHVAAAIGNSLEAKCYLDGGTEPAILWTGVIADSGIGKTKVLDKLSAPFVELEKQYKASYKGELSEYESERKEGNIIPFPKEKHLLVGDSTMEFTFAMCSENPHGLLLCEAEGRLFFAFDKYRKAKTDEANYCKLYDNVFFKIGRKGSDTITGQGIINVAMLIQPDNFRKAITENVGMKTSGLLARIDLCYPPLGKYEISDRIDCTAYQKWNQAINGLVGNRTVGEPVGVYLDDVGQSLWNDYMIKYRNLARQSTGWLGGYYDRVHAKAMRLALQFYCLESGSGFLTSSTVERGIRVAEYLKSQNERVVKMFSAGTESIDREAESIIAKIRQHGGEMTVAELRSSMSSTSKYRQEGGTELLTEKLLGMVKSGLLSRRFKTAENGQSVEVFCVL